MTATRRFYLKLFALMTIPFGVIMLPFYALATFIVEDLSTGYVLGSSAASAVLYGALMTWILGRQHVRAVEALLGATTDDEALRPHQTKVILAGVPYITAFERCLQALREIRRAKIVAQDAAAGTIEARAGASMKSWGEIITVRIEELSSGGSSVEVSSRPSFKPTIVDYGINLEHVLAVERALKDAEGSQPIQ